MFIPRMWDNEVERIGKQRCTPFGYALHGIGDIVGFIGLLILLGMPVYFAFTVIVGTFEGSDVWWLALPLIIGLVGRLMVELSWYVAFRKNFRWDFERRESSWIEEGERRTFTLSDLQAEEQARHVS